MDGAVSLGTSTI